MPTYEYRCPNGHHFERLAKMSESAAELPCPECGKLAARQISGGAGLVFKGSGFYLTDYGRNAHRTSGGEAAAAGKSGESHGGDGGGDSKPSEAKSESKSESKASEGKSSDVKQTESKSSGGKGDGKPGDSKSGGSSSASAASKASSTSGPSSSGGSSKTDK